MDPGRLEELVAAFVERLEAGERLEVEAFLAEHPEGGEELREALGRVPATLGLFPRSLDTVPETVGRYRVLGEIGSGGMGKVLRVEPRDRPGEELALKLLTTATWANPRALERLRREGAALQRLEHEGIVRVLEVGTADGLPFLCMELVRGRSLAELVAAARSATAAPSGETSILSARVELPGAGSGPVRAARLVAQVARAVQAAHDEGLLHRDIKPANVLVRPSGAPVLIDFGLAGGDTGPTLTASGDVLGTPSYMAPEQALGRPVDRRADVYGLGAVLYELLTLRPPHAGSDSVAVLESVRRRPPARVRRIDPGVPRDLETIVLRAMAWRPQDRYPDAASLAADLEAFADRKRIRAGRPGLRERARDAWRVHRLRVTAAAAGLLAVAVAVLVVWRSVEQHAELRREVHARAARAWAAADAEEMRRAAAAMRSLDEADLARWLEGVAAGRRVEGLVDPVAVELEEAARALRGGRPRTAVHRLRAAVAAAPGDPLPVALLGVAARRANDLDVAERELAAAVRMLPRSAALHRELAKVHVARRRFAEAEASLLAAIALSPRDPVLWHELADVRYDAQYQLEESRRDFGPGLEASERAVALAGANPGRDLLMSHARLLDKVERFDEAQAIYRRLLREDPDDVGVLYRLAYSLDSEHEAVEAMRAYQRVLELRPASPTAAMALAYFFHGARLWDGCEQCLAFYAEHPEHLDFVKAVRHAVDALRHGRGRSEPRLRTLVDLLDHIAHPERHAVPAALQERIRDESRRVDIRECLDVLEALRDDAYRKGDDTRAARLGKALWRLRRR